MTQRILGTALLLIALFMFFGFLRAPVAGLVRMVAFLLVVALPAVAGLYLWWSTSAKRAEEREDFLKHKDRLRRQTLEAELIKLAERLGGKLTVVEAVAELGFDAETIEETLKEMAVRGLAEIEISESGMLVYAFRDVQHLGEKDDAKGVLDA